MTHTPRSLREAADVIHQALVAERSNGDIPAGVRIHVYALDGHALAVHIGGLDNDFIVGPGAGWTVAQIANLHPEVYFTPEARRLRNRVLDLIRERLPRMDSGELRHRFHVEIPTEGFWRHGHLPEGVQAIGDNDS